VHACSVFEMMTLIEKVYCSIVKPQFTVSVYEAAVQKVVDVGDDLCLGEAKSNV
jgi:hypothetical protein